MLKGSEALEESKQRIIQEFVPGKQVTLAHVIANPIKDLYSKLGMLQDKGAIGILTITPSEGAMIAADVASKAADISIGFVDRFNGSLVILGDVAAVEAGIRDVMNMLCDKMGFAKTEISRS
ncbi:BMC domain-containing protein [Aminipila sp.]|uniref:BMC domain-containing protein n=1 Tax=Aminipila sp. TaxID=2060095 RepID=UPI00289F5079|nr:BMC domain-containing protein [Aminipila sp.]